MIWAVTANTTPVRIAANSKRAKLFIQNWGLVPIYVSSTPNATGIEVVTWYETESKEDRYLSASMPCICILEEVLECPKLVNP